MTYWHLQMNQPEGRGGSIVIDSKQLLLLDQPVIGCNIWDDKQSLDFQGTSNTPLKNGDIVLVREGQRPIALCRVKGESKPNEALQEKFHLQIYRDVDIIGWINAGHPFPQAQRTLQRLVDPNTDSWRYIEYYLQKLNQEKSMENIINLLRYKPQIILQGPPGTGKTRLAKLVANEICGAAGELKTIQFHPSYSYEDFVRGISAKSTENQIEYVTENRVLAEFAQKAWKNLLNSKKDPIELTKEIRTRNLFEKFKETISDEIDEKERYALNKTASIIAVEDDAFRYTGSVWKNEFRMKFEDVLKLYHKGAALRKEIKHQDYTSSLARTHASYFKILLEKFRDFAQNNPEPKTEVSVEEKKNFVIIIDEINRANLPSVLGELIYALEYRDESVESMYDFEGTREIVLPSNLYIIGTMNTADRSVGHIDYAIRRRFAFVDVLPSAMVLDEAIQDTSLREKAKKLFGAVEALFSDEFLAADFKANDVQLGHSYFLAENEAMLKLKLEYEIKPILREYAKDGIFQAEVKEKIDSLYV